MKRAVVSFAAFALLAGCAGKKSEGTNPIDAVMEKKFAAENITPVEASRPELCRRLAADILGRYLTADEASSQCKGSVDDIVRRFQARPEYLRSSERVWRDRFNSNDVASDWRYLKDLYEQVDRLHQGKLGYKEFAIIAMSHPGFVMSVFQPEDKVKAVFRAFLGRTPTSTESADLAALYRPWLPTQEADPDVPYIYRSPAIILAVLCEPLTTCTASMMGGGQLDLSGFDDPQYKGIKYEDLTEAQLEAIREPGRVFTAQPFFWEAGADEILSRTLAWSDGGRFPREPGIVLPEVREALAEYLKKSDSYRDAERVVYTSWLYRQAAEVPDDGFGDDPAAPVPPVYAHGPVKPAPAEVWLDSTAALTIPLGACDERYGDGFAYFQVFNAIDTGAVSQAQGYADIKKLYDLREDRTPWNDQNQYPDFTYQYVARLIGGCPGFSAQRQAPQGLSYAFSQEALAELLCAPGTAQHIAPGGAAPAVGDVLDWQMKLALGRTATDADKADYVAAKASCTSSGPGADCSGVAMQSAVCVGILGSAEMVFY